jgi:hypothetical protein
VHGEYPNPRVSAALANINPKLDRVLAAIKLAAGFIE